MCVKAKFCMKKRRKSMTYAVLSCLCLFHLVFMGIDQSWKLTTNLVKW